MTRKFTLQRVFNVLVVLLVIAVVLVYVTFRTFSLGPAYEEGEREANNIVSACRDNIENRLRAMSNIANALSYNDEIQNYIQETDPYLLYEKTEYIRSLVSLVCENSSSVNNIIVADNKKTANKANDIEYINKSFVGVNSKKELVYEVAKLIDGHPEAVKLRSKVYGGILNENSN